MVDRDFAKLMHTLPINLRKILFARRTLRQHGIGHSPVEQGSLTGTAGPTGNSPCPRGLSIDQFGAGLTTFGPCKSVSQIDDFRTSPRSSGGGPYKLNFIQIVNFQDNVEQIVKLWPRPPLKHWMPQECILRASS